MANKTMTKNALKGNVYLQLLLRYYYFPVYNVVAVQIPKYVVIQHFLQL